MIVPVASAAMLVRAFASHGFAGEDTQFAQYPVKVAVVAKSVRSANAPATGHSSQRRGVSQCRTANTRGPGCSPANGRNVNPMAKLSGNVASAV